MIIKTPLKAQVRWQCRRGMLELDILLLSFFETHYDALRLEEQAAFCRLLEASDPDIHAWLTAELLAPDLALQNLVSLIQKNRKDKG